MRIELPWWLEHDLLICGNEGEEDGSGDGGGDGAPAGSKDGASGDDGSGGNGDGDDDAGDGDIDDKDVAGLKSALAKERANNKALKSERARLKAAEDELQAIRDKDKSESEKATAAQQKAEAKVAKLAEGYKRSAVDAAIEKVARDLKFIDTDDAVTGVNRADIEVEQDDDDPSTVTVSQKSVKAAVKALADRKKHLVGDGTPGDPSGSKFGGGGGKDKKSQSEEALRNKYPALG